MDGWILVTTLVLGLLSQTYAEPTYAVVAPKVVRPGQKYELSVSVMKSNADVSVTASITSGRGERGSANTIIQQGQSQVISVEIPTEFSGTTANLTVEGRSGSTLVFFNSSQVDIKVKTLSIFVQTDKAMYKPSNLVKFRAIVVTPDLKPYTGMVDIAIFDKAGNKIKQWLDQSGTLGVVSQSLQLSDQPPLGTWNIEVKANGNTMKKSFEVAEYVLPKFEVSVDLPPFLLLKDSLMATVNAMYTYGEPVKGKASFSIQVRPYGMWDSNTYPVINKMIELKDGKADIKLENKDIASLAPPKPSWAADNYDPVQQLNSRTLLAVANVTETITGKMISSNNTVKFERFKYKLQFLDFTPDSFKPGLSYTGYLKLAMADEMPPRAVDLLKPDGTRKTVELKGTMNFPYDGTSRTPIVIEKSLTIPDNGLMEFSINIPKEPVNSMTLMAEFDAELSLSASKYGINKFTSRDNQSIQVSMANSADQALKVGETAKFKVVTTEDITVYNVQVMSRGVIVISEAKAVSSGKTHDYRFEITSDLARSMAPSSRIVVWCLTQGGEIITDSLEFNVDGAFANQVSVAFSTNKTEPAKDLSVTVEAYRNSLVGLLAVDQSVLLLASGNDIDQDMVLDELKNYDSSTKHGGGGPFPMPRGRRKRSICCWPIFSGGKDSLEIFENAGVVVMTDAFIYEEPVPMYPVFERDGPLFARGPGGAPGVAGVAPPRGAAAGPQGQPGPAAESGTPGLQSVNRIRNNFVETWLWSEQSIGDDGKTVIQTKAPDTITSWIASAFAVSDQVGLGIADTKAKITVFKPFFASLNLPYSVIRGEELALQVLVFNYMSVEQKVLVTLEKSMDFLVRSENEVVGTNRKLEVEITVPAGDSKDVSFMVSPTKLGNIPIEVKAQSTQAADGLRRMLLVEPEGIPQTYSNSKLISLTEGVTSFTSGFSITLPSDGLIRDATSITITAIGDIMGPSINGLDKLLKMPYGCGEQNMLNFAPNIYVMQYLQATDQITSEIEAKAINFMEQGYQRELTYKRADGSFSAFGDSDDSGSTWLSAFVIRCFQQATPFISIDQAKIAETVRWLLRQQKTDGGFNEPGRVIHKDMQGGSAQGLGMDAYVLIALLENSKVDFSSAGLSSSTLQAAIDKSVKRLEDRMSDTKVTEDPYVMALASYALSLAGSSMATQALDKLDQLATNEDGMKYWSKTDTSPAPDHGNLWRCPYPQAQSVNIEMTAYGLMTYANRGQVTDGIPIMKWLISQRNGMGGFASTQDTVLGLQALAAFAAQVGGSDSLDMEVSFTAGTISHNFDAITKDNAVLLQSYQLPGDTSDINIMATGRGIGLVQVIVNYNVMEDAPLPGIELQVKSEQQSSMVITEGCAKWVRDDQSGMVATEFIMLSGYQAIDVEEIKSQAPGIKRVETTDNKVVIYMDELTAKELCVKVKSQQAFPVANLQAARVFSYLYYEPKVVSTKYYLPEALKDQAMCDACPTCCVGGLVNENPTKPPNPGPDVGTSSATTLAGVSMIVSLTLALIGVLVF